jgi:hypothetical protein
MKASSLLLRLGTFLLCVSGGGLSGSADSKNQVGQRQVQLAAVNKQTLKPDPSVKGDLGLVQYSYTVKKDESVFEVLKKEHIQPDIEAITLMYELNPSVQSFKVLQEGQEIAVPAVARNGQRIDIGQADIVLVTLDPDLKTQFKQVVTDTKAIISARKAPEPVAPCGTDQMDACLVEMVGILNQIRLGIVQRNGPPLTRRDLILFNKEAESVKSLCELRFTRHQALSGSDAAQLRRIQGDLHMTASRLNDVMGGAVPDAPCQYLVKVTVRGASKPVLDGLRVYYLEDGRWTGNPTDDAVAFPTLGDSADKLCWRDYQFWGAKAGHPTQSLTEILLRQIRSADELELSLTAQP